MRPLKKRKRPGKADVKSEPASQRVRRAGPSRAGPSRAAMEVIDLSD
jgi:hypothetical protein